MAPVADDRALIWLLRRSVRRYQAPVAGALRRAGFADLPIRGAWALSALALPGTTNGDLAAIMGITKQATSQLIDGLVESTYVERRADPDDRRRVLLLLTRRGRQAVEVIDRALAELEAEVGARIGPDALEGLRRSLSAFLSP